MLTLITRLLSHNYHIYYTLITIDYLNSVILLNDYR